MRYLYENVHMFLALNVKLSDLIPNHDYEEIYLHLMLLFIILMLVLYLMLPIVSLLCSLDHGLEELSESSL